MRYGACGFGLSVLCAALFCGQAWGGQVQTNPDREANPVPGSAIPASRTPATYDGFVTSARALRAGMARSDIIAALGLPTEEGPDFLRYSLIELPGFPGLPGPPGSQVFAGARIPLEAGRMTGPVGWAWVDTTGPGPAAPRPVPGRQ